MPIASFGTLYISEDAVFGGTYIEGELVDLESESASETDVNIATKCAEYTRIRGGFTSLLLI